MEFVERGLNFRVHLSPSCGCADQQPHMWTAWLLGALVGVRFASNVRAVLLSGRVQVPVYQIHRRRSKGMRTPLEALACAASVLESLGKTQSWNTGRGAYLQLTSMLATFWRLPLTCKYS